MPHSKELEAWFEEPATPWSWTNAWRAERYASSLGGAFLLAFGSSRKSLGGALVAAMGTGLLVRGIGGIGRDRAGGPLIRLNRAEGIKVHRSVTVLKDPSDLFERARSLEGASKPMRQLQSLREGLAGRHKIVVHMPRGGYLDWDAKATWHEDEQRVTWATEEGASLRHAGSLTFRPAPGDKGTEVHVVLEYEFFSMTMGFSSRRLSGDDVASRLSESLRRYKQLMECGEIATTRRQPSGRKGLPGRRLRRAGIRSQQELIAIEPSEATP